MIRLLSAFRVLMQPGFCAKFSTSASSAQVSAITPLRTAVSAVKPPNDIMRFVELRDADRLKAIQPQQFGRPKPGDIVEVDFINLNLNNMNKTQKFKGICIEARKGLASSSFVLRCVVDEVGMQYRRFEYAFRENLAGFLFWPLGSNRSGSFPIAKFDVPGSIILEIGL